MQVRVAVGMLVILVLVSVAPSMTEGLVVSRCELKQKLEQILPTLSNVAKIVCYAEAASGLNTSNVTQVASRKARSNPDSGPKPDKSDIKSNSTGYNQTHSHDDDHVTSGVEPTKSDAKSDGKKGKTNKGRPSRSLKLKPGPKPGKDAEAHPVVKPPKPITHDESSESGHTVTLYGVFQLPDRVACSSSTTASLNVCGLTCDKLVDDDITDDIACFGTLSSISADSATEETAELIKKWYYQFYQKTCVVNSNFFNC